MRHRNNVKQLGRTHAHRKALYRNMVTSLFLHERIVTTREKAKEIQKESERLITRAKKNIALQDAHAQLHNKREVMKVISNRDVVKKLFEDIALRFKDRNGGYTRIMLLSERRDGDAAEMAILELVEKEPAGDVKKADKKSDKKAEAKKDKKEKK
jgi:large subunit ribosomal protein L17